MAEEQTNKGILGLQENLYGYSIDEQPVLSTPELNALLTKVVQEVDYKKYVTQLQGVGQASFPLDSNLNLRGTIKGSITSLPYEGNEVDISGRSGLGYGPFFAEVGAGNRRSFSQNSNSDKTYGEGIIGANIPLNEESKLGISALYNTMNRNPIYNTNLDYAINRDQSIGVLAQYDKNRDDKSILLNYSKRF